MPFCPPVTWASLTKSALASQGAPGTVTTEGYNPVWLMIDLACAALWADIQAHLCGGVWVGSAGGPTSAVLPPAPVPFVGPPQLAALTATFSGLVPTLALEAAASAGWIGVAATAIPAGVALGFISALSQSTWSVAGAPADTVYLSLTAGVLSWSRAALPATAMIPKILAAWNSSPLLRPADRLGAAQAVAGPIAAILALLDLTCGVVNAAPPGVAPVVPGTPYPPTIPWIFT